MLPLAATNSSNTAGGSGVTNWLGASEAIALIAVGVSALTWFYSRRMEARIRAEGDERSKFDTVFGNPLTARLEQLESVVMDFGRCIRENSTMAGRAGAISVVQTHEHSDWYFGIHAFLESQKGDPSAALRIELDTYWDTASFYIDEMSNAVDTDRARQELRRLRTHADGYLGNTRTLLMEHRASIDGNLKPFWRVPTFLRGRSKN